METKYFTSFSNLILILQSCKIGCLNQIVSFSNTLCIKKYLKDKIN